MFKSVDDVKEYINKTLKKYSKRFATSNYTVRYSNRQRRALATTCTRYLMGQPISIEFVFNLKYLKSYEVNADNIKNTVLHEIAHAIAGNHHHHDSYWVKCCNQIGAVPSRYTSVKF